MADLNRAEIIGRLGQDPDMRQTQGGIPVANMSVATSYKPKDGEEQTEWHRVVAFGKLADVCGQYLAKGRQVFVEGRLQTRKWEDKEGNARYTTEIVANNVQFLGGKSEGHQPVSSPSPGGTEARAIAGAEDDLPF